MAGHCASKTRVNALISRPSTTYLLREPKKDVDVRHKAGNDKWEVLHKNICATKRAFALQRSLFDQLADPVHH